MKSSSAVFRALSIALLAAVVLYFGVQGCRYLTDPYSTTLAYRSSSEESISLTGWLVRDEEPLQGPSGTLQQMLREGEKAAAGETVVTVYSDARRARHRQPGFGSRSCSSSSCSSRWNPISTATPRSSSTAPSPTASSPCAVSSRTGIIPPPRRTSPRSRPPFSSAATATPPARRSSPASIRSSPSSRACAPRSLEPSASGPRSRGSTAPPATATRMSSRRTRWRI